MFVFSTSDKGGTGRTVTSSNIVYRRALQGSSVCYLDFDFGSPTAGAIFGINYVQSGTPHGGLHRFIQGEIDEPHQVDAWAESDRTSLVGRPSGAGELVLFPGDKGGSKFDVDENAVERCVELLVQLNDNFDLILMDLSAGRSFATELVLRATADQRLRAIPARWLIFHRWTRQHVIAASGLTLGEGGILDIGHAVGHDRDRLLASIRYVRTAVVNPAADELSGLRGPQITWLHQMDRELNQLAGSLGIGRMATLGSVPLDPVLQWREQLITDSDTVLRDIANPGTVDAFETLAKKLTDSMDPPLTELTTSFVEATGSPVVRAVPMSHLSVEVGHLYLEDLEGGPEAVLRKLEAVAPWAKQATVSLADGLGKARPRVSTCYLIDDYFSPDTSPAEVIPLVLKAARGAGVAIDYLARESSCATESGVAIAELVAGQIVAEPHPASNGARPAAAVSGWLSNGRRSPTGPNVAMKPRQWQPPSESAAKRHSIFVDVQLWSDEDGDRLYSRPFLAAVWQLARLGLLRNNGEPLLQPQEWMGPWPSNWQALPGVVRLNREAAPFSAYSTLSVISERFLPIEHAVRTVLSQIAVDPTAHAQIVTQAEGNQLRLADSIVERIGYVFAHEPWEAVRRSPARPSRAPETAARGPRPVPDPGQGEY